MKRLLFFLALPLLAQSPQLTDGAGHQLRLIRDGAFIMGYNRYHADFARTFRKDHVPFDTIGETPAHHVHITKPFYMAAHEVTVAQFRAFVDATNYVTTAEKSGDGIVGFHNVIDYQDNRQKRRFRRVADYSWKHTGFEQADNHPVVGVSWEDANAYCRWLSRKEGATYRLPTEAEWEYAANASKQGFFCFGNDWRRQIHEFANHADQTLEDAYEETAGRLWYLTGQADGHVFTSPVGSLKANDWGLHDMHGNVWELCQDLYLDTFYNRYKARKNTEPPRWVADPANLDSPWNPDAGEYRIIKGGSYHTNPAQCHTSYRSYVEKADGFCYTGFRVVREANGPLMAEAAARFAAQREAMTAMENHPDVKIEMGIHKDLSSRVVVNPANADLAQHFADLPRVAILEIHRGCPPNFIPEIAKLTDLRGLRIYQPGRDLPREAFAPLAQLRHLEELNINNYSNIHPEDVATWACVENLRILSLGNDQLDGSGFAKFAGKDFSKLEELHMHSFKTDGTELAHFRGAPLTKVSVQSLSDEGAAIIAEFPDIVELRISEPKITAAGLAHLAKLKKLTSLRLANLKTLEDADFAPLAQMTSLERITLSGSGAGDLTAAALAKLPNIRQVNIGSSAFTDEGMRHIGGIATLNHLLEIGQHAAITDAGLEHIWAPDRVTMLFLKQKYGITGTGLNSIAENLTRLVHIEISSADFGDEGMRLLGYMPQLKVFRLHTQESKVTDAGLLAIAEAPKLKQLDIRGDGHAITDAGIAAMKEKLPHVEVLR